MLDIDYSATKHELGRAPVEMGERTSYRLFSTVNGFNTNPTLVRATAPATRFPCEFSFGNALVIRRRSSALLRSGIRSGNGTSGRAGSGLSVVIVLAGAGEGNVSILGCGFGVGEAAK